VLLDTIYLDEYAYYLKDKIDCNFRIFLNL